MARHFPAEGSPADATPGRDIAEQLEILSVERDRLQSERDDLLNSDFSVWLSAVQAESEALDFQNTVIWRLTKPIYYAHAFRSRMRDEGLWSAIVRSIEFLSGRR